MARVEARFDSHAIGEVEPVDESASTASGNVVRVAANRSPTIVGKNGDRPRGGNETELFVDGDSAGATTNFVRVAHARIVAVRRRSDGGTASDGVVAVALAGIFQTGVEEAIAELLAELDGHGISFEVGSSKGARGASLDVASDWLPTGRSGSSGRRAGAGSGGSGSGSRGRG